MKEKSFHKIAAGGFAVSLGTIAALLFKFLFGVLLIRSVTQSEFGLFSLGNTLASMAVIVCVMGLDVGIPRFIARARQQADRKTIANTIGFSLAAVPLCSTLFCLLLFLSAPFLSRLFDKPDLQTVFRALLVMLLPLALMRVLASIFRGIENPLPKVLFEDLALFLLRLVGLSFVFLFKFDFQGVLYLYTGTAWLVFLIFSFYSKKRLAKFFPLGYHKTTARDLLIFSLPVLGLVMMDNLAGWAGILILGYFRSAAEVGLYTAPLRLASLLAVPLSAMVFLYLPIAVRLNEAGENENLQELYSSTTKWIWFFTLPALMFFLIDAEYIVRTLFGTEYLGSANVFRILALGMSYHAMLGPNATTLICLGKTRTVMVSTILACLTTLVCCWLLVPPMGTTGAAIGITLAKIVSNSLVSEDLRRVSGIQPCGGWRLVVTILCPAIPAGALLYWLLTLFSGTGLFIHIVLLITVAVTVLAELLIFRCITPKDVEIIQGLERKIFSKTRFSDLLHRHVSRNQKP